MILATLLVAGFVLPLGWIWYYEPPNLSARHTGYQSELAFKNERTFRAANRCAGLVLMVLSIVSIVISLYLNYELPINRYDMSFALTLNCGLLFLHGSFMGVVTIGITEKYLERSFALSKTKNGGTV